MADTGLITSIDAGRAGTAKRTNGLANVLPADASSELPVEYLDLGIITEAGVTHSISRETEDRKGLGGDVVYTLQTTVDNNFVLTLMESQNLDVLKTIVGDANVIVDGAGNVKVRHNKVKLPRCSWVFDFVIDQGIKRTVVGTGQVISVGDVSNTNTEILQYEVTIKAYQDPRLDGDLAQDFYAYEGGGVRLGVASAMLPPATVGQPYRFQVSATGGTAPYTWTATGLPDGLTMASDGTIAGTPTTANEVGAEVTITVSDSAGVVAEKPLTLVVTAE